MEVADSVAARWILGTEDVETSQSSGAQGRRCVRELWSTQVHITMDELFPDHISVMNCSDLRTYTCMTRDPPRAAQTQTAAAQKQSAAAAAVVITSSAAPCCCRAQICVHTMFELGKNTATLKY